MTNVFAKFAIAALVGIGAMSVTSQANAGSVDVDVHVRAPRVVVREPVVVVKPIHARPPVVVVKPGYGRCQPGLALEKAANRGLNRVAISSVGPNRVVVTGKIRGMWAKVAFANVRGCPRL